MNIQNSTTKQVIDNDKVVQIVNVYPISETDSSLSPQ
jgi:hypothetical protein